MIKLPLADTYIKSVSNIRPSELHCENDIKGIAHPASQLKTQHHTCGRIASIRITLCFGTMSNYSKVSLALTLRATLNLNHTYRPVLRTVTIQSTMSTIQTQTGRPVRWTALTTNHPESGGCSGVFVSASSVGDIGRQSKLRQSNGCPFLI